MNDIWNPWHGCKKYSEGCENCYMFYLDKQREQDPSNIYKVKTNFNLPLKKERNGNYKIPSGMTIRVCMTSDFFLEEADEWRKDVWQIIKQRPDVNFWLLTKRANRIEECLPDDWNDGYENVYLNVTTENQTRADERIPILLNIPAKHKGIMIAPFIGEVCIEKYLKEGQIESVLADGENYDRARPLHYEWVKKVYDECVAYDVPFRFFGTGNLFIKDGKTYNIIKAYQSTEALRSGLQYPKIDGDFSLQKRCKTCKMNTVCGGCKHCGKCR